MTEVLNYLDDILDGVKKIKQYTREMSYEEFVTDPKTVDAVLRNFEMIGEAAKNVPEDIRHGYQTYRGPKWPECAIN